MKKAVLVGHPFKNFQIFCQKLNWLVESWRVGAMRILKKQKLGEWLRLAKSLQAEEAEIKNRMPLVTKHILEKKRIALMRHRLNRRGTTTTLLQMTLSVASAWLVTAHCPLCYLQNLFLPLFQKKTCIGILTKPAKH